MVLAMGVEYRRLGIPSFEDLSGRGVFYGYSPSDAPRFTDGAVFVVGGANSAGQAAVHLSRYAASVTLLCRGARSMRCRRYLIDEIESQRNVDVRLSTRVVGGAGEDWLERLDARGPGGHDDGAADALFILIGAEPRTGWLPDEIARDGHGFVVTGRGEHMFETSAPGVFAIGDVRAGSVKRVASAVGEGSVVIHQVHRYLETAHAAGFAPERPAGRQRVMSSQAAELSNALSSSSCASPVRIDASIVESAAYIDDREAETSWAAAGRSAIPEIPSIVSSMSALSLSTVEEKSSTACFASSPDSGLGRAEILHVVAEGVRGRRVRPPPPRRASPARTSSGSAARCRLLAGSPSTS